MGDTSNENPSGCGESIGSVSVVLPVFNEEDCIEDVVREIAGVLAGLDLETEILMVDDGSTDATPGILARLASELPTARCIALPRNMGQSAAMLAGMRVSEADVIVTMDADGQNDPADIPALLAGLEGHDCVCGYRPRRQDSPMKRLGSRLANAIRGRFLSDGIIDTGCSLKAVRREFTTELPSWNGIHRFLPVFYRLAGASRINQVPTNHRSRAAGESKYSNFGRLRKTIWDLFAVRWMISRWVDLRNL